MKQLIALLVLAGVLAAAGYADSRRDRAAEPGGVRQLVSTASTSDDGWRGTPMERLERAIKMKGGSKKAVGELELSSGRKLELYTAETKRAEGCLIESDPLAGATAGCLEGGLFTARRVAFSVNTEGGPERFEELHVLGLVAPNIRSATLTLTDGSEVPLQLTRTGAFLYEGSKSQLADAIYPNGFRLYGQSGKLVEVVAFPPAGA